MEGTQPDKGRAADGVVTHRLKGAAARLLDALQQLRRRHACTHESI
jgi:hypothetical protein